MVDEELGPRQRAAETKRRRTREAIVNGTLDLYADQQMGDYTLEQIAEAAGISAATVANHFETKYGVLRTAYGRLLSPVVDPIVKGTIAGIYNPPDAVDELIRYFYTVASVSQKHRALTVAMIRAYSEVELDRVLLSIKAPDYMRSLLGGPIAPGIGCILQLSSFHPRGNPDSYARSLLHDLYHESSDYAAKAVSRDLSERFVKAHARDFSWSPPRDWMLRIERVEAAVDASGIVDECGA
jgi:AcrR family transcriptional regulator